MLDRSSAFPSEGQAIDDKVENALPPASLVQRCMKKILRLGWLFFATVMIPTVIAILYFGLFASDVYISESKFVVREPDKPAASGLGILLKTAGFSNASNEVYAARDYVLSRDAARDLNRGEALRLAYGASHISIFDRFDPVGLDRSFEALYKFYRSKIAVEHDVSSSITTLTVRAYTPRDAQRLNTELLARAEALVNGLNTRGRMDLITAAEQEVAGAKNRAAQAAAALAQFRNREGVVDPERQATAQLQMISKLQDQLISMRIQLLQLRTYTPKNPQIPVLEAGDRSLSKQIDEELGKIAGGKRSLSSSAVQYQRLVIESQVADKQVAASLASLEEARNEALRKQAYVERIVQPNLPDAPLEPRRVRGVITTFVLGLIACGILSMLLAGVREHRD